VGLLQQAWEETFGNSAGLSRPENDVMEINPTSAMPNGDNIRKPNPVEMLQISPSADETVNGENHIKLFIDLA
jgi:hypothetical protein